jgi:hypothetical protein
VLFVPFFGALLRQVEEPTPGTRVDLNEVRFPLSVDHKVET